MFFVRLYFENLLFHDKKIWFVRLFWFIFVEKRRNMGTIKRILITVFFFGILHNVNSQQPIGYGSTPYNGNLYHPYKIMVGAEYQPQNILHIHNPHVQSDVSTISEAYLQITNKYTVSSIAGATLPTSLNGLKIGLNSEDNGRGAIINQQENSFLKFATNATDRAIIKNNGYVGIGTMTPAHILHVHGNDSVGGSIDNHDLRTRRTAGISKTAKGDKLLPIGNISLGITQAQAYAAIQLTNNATGTDATDGLLFEMKDDDAVINLQEQGSISFRNSNNVSLFISKNNNVGIGTTNPNGYKLAVKGTAHILKLVVNTYDWGDYVFDEDYKLLDLNELEDYIKKYKHLPNIPSESEVKENGIDVAEMNKLLLQKIEELTLYVIELQKQIDELKKENDKNQNGKQ